LNCDKVVANNRLFKKNDPDKPSIRSLFMLETFDGV
jgi:hypothetical protein